MTLHLRILAAGTRSANATVPNYPRLDMPAAKLVRVAVASDCSSHGSHPMMPLARARSAVSCSMPTARDVCPPRVIPLPLGWSEGITV